MPGIAAGPGSVRSPFSSSAFAQHPCHPERAGSRVMGTVEPCYPTQPSSPSRAKTAAKERCLSPTSATDLQHEHRSDRVIPASRTLATPSTQVEVRLTPSLQLQASLRRSLATKRKKEERRTGAALRCVGVFCRAQRSKPNPLTPPVPLLRLRTDVAVPPSRGTPSPARGAFHRPVSPSLLAHRRKPATSPAALPPLGRLPAPRHLQRRWGRRFRISFRLRLNDWTRESIQGSSPRCRAGWAPPVDFCNHHGFSSTSYRATDHPAHRAGSCAPAR